MRSQDSRNLALGALVATGSFSLNERCRLQSKSLQQRKLLISRVAPQLPRRSSQPHSRGQEVKVPAYRVPPTKGRDRCRRPSQMLQLGCWEAQTAYIHYCTTVSRPLHLIDGPDLQSVVGFFVHCNHGLYCPLRVHLVELRWVNQLKGKLVSLCPGRLLCFNGTGRDSQWCRCAYPISDGGEISLPRRARSFELP